MSVTAPAYAFLAATMLTLCGGFLAWWLAVVVVRTARQLPRTHAWLKRSTLNGSRSSRHNAVRLLFSAPTAPASLRVAGASSVNATANGDSDTDGDVLHRSTSPRDGVRDRGGGAGAADRGVDGVARPFFDRPGHPPRDQYKFNLKLNDEPAMARERDSCAWRRRRVEIDLSIAWRARACNTLHNRDGAMALCSGG